TGATPCSAPVRSGRVSQLGRDRHPNDLERTANHFLQPSLDRADERAQYQGVHTRAEIPGKVDVLRTRERNAQLPFRPSILSRRFETPSGDAHSPAVETELFTPFQYGGPALVNVSRLG